MLSLRTVFRIALGLGVAGAIATVILLFPVLDSRADEDASWAYGENLRAGRAAYDSLNYVEAERHYREALSPDVTWYAPWRTPKYRDDATALLWLGDAIAAQGRYEEAEAIFKRALSVQQAARGRRAEILALALSRLGAVYEATGRDSLALICEARRDSLDGEMETILKAEVERERALARPDARLLAVKLMQLGNHYYSVGRPDLAGPLFAEACDIRVRAFGPTNGYTMEALAGLGFAWAGLHEPVRATGILREVLAWQETEYGTRSVRLLPCLEELAASAFESGRYVEADSLLGRMLAIQEHAVGRDQFVSVPTLQRLARCRTELGNFAAAREAQARVIGIDQRVFGSNSRQVGSDYLRLSIIEDRAGKRSRAVETCQQALYILTLSAGGQDPLTRECQAAYDELLKPPGPRAGGPSAGAGDWDSMG